MVKLTFLSNKPIVISITVRPLIESGVDSSIMISASSLPSNMLTQNGIYPNFVVTLSEGHHFE